MLMFFCVTPQNHSKLLEKEDILGEVVEEMPGLACCLLGVISFHSDLFWYSFTNSGF